MNSVRVKSYAKINLTLDVTGVCGGYHAIDSLAASVDLADVITARKRKDGLINVVMHGEGSETLPAEENNAVKAGEEFVKEFGCGGADITIWKNIPVGAGLGGSSADVAGVLRAMSKLYGADSFSRVKAVADRLGSDCGYMLTGGYARIAGRGERVFPIESRMKLDIVLLVPAGGVSTAECYALSDSLPKGEPATERAVNALLCGDVRRLCENLNNHLYGAAVRLEPAVAEAYGQLKQFDPAAVNMTGSGSGVYAVTENDQFAQYIKSRYRGRHRLIVTKTVIPVKEENNG